MKLNRNRKAGFTLVEILIVVVIIGLLTAIAVPNFVKARTNSQKSTCIANLKQIEGAIASWALDNKKLSTDAVAMTDVSGSDSAYIKTVPTCPAGGSYTLSTVATRPTCSIDGHTL